MDKIYVGSFIREHGGELKALVNVEGEASHYTAKRKIYKDKTGNYVLNRGEKQYFDMPKELELSYSKDGIEYLTEKSTLFFKVRNFDESN